MNQKSFPPSSVRLPLIYVQQCHVPVHVKLCMHFCDLHTLPFVCCHGAHNRRSFRANLLCYHGDSNPTEGGRGGDGERWGLEARREGTDACSSQENASPSRTHQDAPGLRHLIWTFKVITRGTKTGDVGWGRWAAERSQLRSTSPGCNSSVTALQQINAPPASLEASAYSSSAAAAEDSQKQLQRVENLSGLQKLRP